MAISQNRKNRYTWKSGELSVVDGIGVPRRLEEVVSNAPKTAKNAIAYLTQLVADAIIDQEDADFLIDSGILGAS